MSAKWSTMKIDKNMDVYRLISNAKWNISKHEHNKLTYSICDPVFTS